MARNQMGYIPTGTQTVVDALRGFLTKFRTGEEDAEKKRLERAMMGLPTEYMEKPSTLRTVLSGIPEGDRLTQAGMGEAFAPGQLTGKSLPEVYASFQQQMGTMPTYKEKQRKGLTEEMSMRIKMETVLNKEKEASSKANILFGKIIDADLPKEYANMINKTLSSLVSTTPQKIEALKGVVAAMDSSITGGQKNLKVQRDKLLAKIQSIETQYAIDSRVPEPSWNPFK